MRAVVLASICLAAFVGCSASDNKLFSSGGTGNSSTGGSGSSSSGTSTGANGIGATGTGAGGTGGQQGLGGNFNVGDAGGPPGCSAASQLAYVFSAAGDIYSFDPPSKVFTMIATPGCPGQANSMAIDRNLTAWLNYIGTIYTYDLNTNGPCKPSGITLPAAFQQVGMGFSTDAVGGTAETLYLSSISGGGLGKVDMATKTVVPISASGMGGELTGTGDARLFEYFTSPVSVAQINKSTGAILNNMPLGVPTPSDWAFSFWGGDFYVYAAPNGNIDGNSSVIHYTPSTNTVDTAYVMDVGFAIVGAGVSTCAPSHSAAVVSPRRHACGGSRHTRRHAQGTLKLPRIKSPGGQGCGWTARLLAWSPIALSTKEWESAPIAKSDAPIEANGSSWTSPVVRGLGPMSSSSWT